MPLSLLVTSRSRRRRRTMLVLLGASVLSATACGGGGGARGTAARPPAPSLSTTARGHVGAGAELAAWDSTSCPAAFGPRGSSAASSGATPSTDRPDVILCVAVGAREVTFATQPQISVRLTGALGDSVHVLERRNLPRPVGAGSTYRDVFVAVQILGHLAGDCRSQARADSAAPAAAPPSGLCESILRADSAAGRPR